MLLYKYRDDLCGCGRDLDRLIISPKQVERTEVELDSTLNISSRMMASRTAISGAMRCLSKATVPSVAARRTTFAPIASSLRGMSINVNPYNPGEHARRRGEPKSRMCALQTVSGYCECRALCLSEDSRGEAALLPFLCCALQWGAAISPFSLQPPPATPSCRHTRLFHPMP